MTRKDEQETPLAVWSKDVTKRHVGAHGFVVVDGIGCEGGGADEDGDLAQVDDELPHHTAGCGTGFTTGVVDVEG